MHQNSYDEMDSQGFSLAEPGLTVHDEVFGEEGNRNLREAYYFGGGGERAQKSMDRLMGQSVVAQIDGSSHAFPQTSYGHRNVSSWYLTDAGAAFGLNESPRNGLSLAISGPAQVKKFYAEHPRTVAPKPVAELLARVNNSQDDALLGARQGRDGLSLG